MSQLSMEDYLKLPRRAQVQETLGDIIMMAAGTIDRDYPEVGAANIVQDTIVRIESESKDAIMKHFDESVESIQQAAGDYPGIDKHMKYFKTVRTYLDNSL